MSEDTIHRLKRQTTEWEKILANHTCDKGLTYRIYRKHPKLNNNNKNNQIWKWAKELNRHFSKEHIQLANKHMKDAQPH